MHVPAILKALELGERMEVADAEIAAFETAYLRPGIAQILGRPLDPAEWELVVGWLEDYPTLTDEKLARYLRYV